MIVETYDTSYDITDNFTNDFVKPATVLFIGVYIYFSTLQYMLIA